MYQAEFHEILARVQCHTCNLFGKKPGRLSARGKNLPELLRLLLFPLPLGRGYCSISFNSAGPVTRYHAAENFISALSEFGRDKARNSAVRRRRPQNLTMLSF